MASPATRVSLYLLFILCFSIATHTILAHDIVAGKSIKQSIKDKVYKIVQKGAIHSITNTDQCVFDEHTFKKRRGKRDKVSDIDIDESGNLLRYVFNDNMDDIHPWLKSTYNEFQKVLEQQPIYSGFKTLLHLLTNSQAFKRYVFNAKMFVVENVITKWIDGSQLIFKQKYEQSMLNFLAFFQFESHKKESSHNLDEAQIFEDNDVSANIIRGGNIRQIMKQWREKLMKVIAKLKQKAIDVLRGIVESLMPFGYKLINSVLRWIIINGWNTAKRVMSNEEGIAFERYVYEGHWTKRGHDMSLMEQTVIQIMRRWTDDYLSPMTAQSLNFGFNETLNRMDGLLENCIQKEMAEMKDEKWWNINLKKIRKWFRLQLLRLFRWNVEIMKKIIQTVMDHVLEAMAVGNEAPFDETKLNIDFAFGEYDDLLPLSH